MSAEPFNTWEDDGVAFFFDEEDNEVIVVDTFRNTIALIVPMTVVDKFDADSSQEFADLVASSIVAQRKSTEYEV